MTLLWTRSQVEQRAKQDAKDAHDGHLVHNTFKGTPFERVWLSSYLAHQAELLRTDEQTKELR